MVSTYILIFITGRYGNVLSEVFIWFCYNSLISKRLLSTKTDVIFVLNINTDHSLMLADGRSLGFCRFGSATAEPVLMFHGTPGSRYFAFPAGTPLDNSTMQIILPERPGYGLSTNKPGRTILDWCVDILQLVDSLGLEKFHILGLSGGGPYALACAYQMPDRVKSVQLMASVAPLSEAPLREGMALSNKMAIFVARHFSLAIRFNFYFNRYSLFKHPKIYLEKLYTQFSDWDEVLLQKPTKQQRFLQHMREAYRHGIEGAVSDIQLLLRPWGFELSEITTRVRLWQGELDTMVPPAMGHYLSEQLPNCQTEFIPGAGHLLFMDDNLIKPILASVIQN